MSADGIREIKYTDEEREEAIEACAMMASSNADNPYTNEAASYFGHAIDTDCRAAVLAREALWSIPWNYAERERWAEAEALLRDGWSPGEEVVSLCETDE